ncbi:lipopolysaccharide transport periplasmic protein LptA [Congregibacter brevis]|uniref:Lipopolysaccharide export system protein LptA n=1 Tax=Congregibacter brevis TaxID=3081201 RepID=A0ABZ0IJ73_9GAMM|nr:lipopolysaccharide transport periplasmic protein LptA [Congregibacter sp. IMCC45268]
MFQRIKSLNAHMLCATSAVFALCLVFTGLLAPGLALALPDDRLQSIEITAARAVRDERAGFTVYSGDVIMQQGSLHITADKITIFHDSEAADRIIAIGEPATLRQQPEIDKGFVTASAGRIVYQKSREWVQLREAAVIEQDGAVVSGESIDYFMAEQRVRADADSDDANGRVQVIIPAAVIEAESSDNAEPESSAVNNTSIPPTQDASGGVDGDPDGA